MLDSVIVGGELVHSWGREIASIGIKDGVIAGIYRPGDEPEANETLDASGRLVVPGMIDMHSHHREGTEQPGFDHKEDILTVTRACAAGGVTTTVGMPNIQPPPTTVERLAKLFERYERSAIVDYNVNPAGTVIEEIPGLAERGVPALKVFMVVDTGRDYPHMPGIGVHHHGDLLAIMKECARVGVPLMVHPHDQELMDNIEQEFWARGERDAAAYAKAYAAHDGLIWETAIATLIRMQAATGCHLHLLHVQTAGSVEMIRAAKARGQQITAEINPWALFLGNRWENIEKWGSYALSYWVPEVNEDALWQGLGDGTIDIVATDHAPHTREEKEIGWTDGWKAHTGTPSTQFVVALLHTAAAAGKIDLSRVVEATSSAPAAIFGLKGKGRIAAGFDADLVVMQPGSHIIDDAEVLSKIGWTPYAGVEVSSVPQRTLVRGSTVYLDGEVVGEPGYGVQAKASS